MQAFILPTQHSTEVNMDAASESSDSLVSMHSEDSCASKSGADCYEHLERNSPTSLLPEHPFSAPVLLVTFLTLSGVPQWRPHAEGRACLLIAALML